MAFAVFDWQNYLAGGTEIDAAALQDMETRLSDYSDSVAAGGIELDYAERASDFTTTSTSWVDVTGLAITAPSTTRPIVVEFNVGSVYNSSGTGGVAIRILEDGSPIPGGAGASSLDADASAGNPMTRIRRRAASGASRDYKVQAKALFGGTVTLIGAGDTGPMHVAALTR